MLESDWPVLEGSKCTLRVLSLSDARSWHAGEDEEQRRWFNFPHPAPLENVINAIENWRHHWSTDGPVRHWGLWCDGALAGGVEVREREDRRVNVSYVVFPPHRRQGVAYEAVQLATRWALGHLGVDCAVGVVDEQNIASRRVLERSGFVQDGVARVGEYGESDATGVMLRYVYEP